jgi:putative flippase GtrA
VRWFVVQTSGLLVNLGLVYLFVDGVGLGKLSGQAVTIVIVTLLTFFANRAWTFRGHTPAALAETSVDT